MKFPISLLIACALVGPGAFLTRSAPAQDAADAYAPLAPEDLQQLVAPFALYPDAMLAQIFVACTYPNDVAAAVQYIDGGGDPNAIDSQGWDLSVAGIARYPDLLHYLNNNVDLMNNLGAAFLNQQADVMAAVQVLRGQAQAAGNLVSNDEQQVVTDDQGDIEIIPADPQNIYPPIYDPALVYQSPVVVPGVDYVPLIRYWHPIRTGEWLHHDLDWHDHSIYLGSWGVNRPWWNHDRNGGRFDYTHDRPGLYASNNNFNVNVHNRVVNVRGGAWTRQMHDPQKPMPRFTARPAARPTYVRPGRGYEPRGAVQRPGAGGIAGYNHAPSVAAESNRGRESLNRSGIQNRPAPVLTAPPRRVEAPRAVRREAPAPVRSAQVHEAPAARGGAVGGYGNGAAASHASSRGASSRGGGRR